VRQLRRSAFFCQRKMPSGAFYWLIIAQEQEFRTQNSLWDELWIPGIWEKGRLCSSPFPDLATSSVHTYGARGLDTDWCNSARLSQPPSYSACLPLLGGLGTVYDFATASIAIALASKPEARCVEWRSLKLWSLKLWVCRGYGGDVCQVAQAMPLGRSLALSCHFQWVAFVIYFRCLSMPVVKDLCGMVETV
jgi:hypothetical protein